MRTVTIGFSKPKEFKIFAKLIMWYEESDWSHAYVKFNAVNIERHLIYQASGRMVNFEGSIHFENHALSIHEYQIDVTDEQYKSVMQFCVDNAGVKYGILSALGAGLVKLGKKLNISIKNPFEDGNRSQFCSELAARVLNQLSLINLDYDLDDITPKDLKEALDEIPEAKKVL